MPLLERKTARIIRSAPIKVKKFAPTLSVNEKRQFAVRQRGTVLLDQQQSHGVHVTRLHDRLRGWRGFSRCGEDHRGRDMIDGRLYLLQWRLHDRGLTL